MIFAMAAGVYDLSSLKVLRALLGWETGPAHIVVWSVRFPCIVAGLVAGWGLALSGVAMQSLLKNPLGSPFTLGVSHGAAFGAAFAIVVLGAGRVQSGVLRTSATALLSLQNLYLVSFFAFLGAMITTLVILFLARVKKMSLEAIILGGVGYKGAHGLASTEPRYIPLALVGAQNLAQKVSQRDHVFIDKEQLLAWNPKIIFLDGTGFSLVAQEYQKDPKFFQGLTAFQQQQVYLLFPFNFYTTKIDTALADAYAVGKILAPQKFTDIDPKRRADEIYTFFVGQPVYDRMAKDFGQLGQVIRLGQAN